MSTLRLAILDTTHILDGQTARAALRTSLTLAARGDDLGFSRYWLAEHHTPGHAQSSPEVLLPLVASMTSRIRVGSAGILLAYHSPYRVAQSFRLLESLFPGRIDLGLARGVVSAATAQALLAGRADAIEPARYQAQVDELLQWLRGDATAPTAPHRQAPATWILGHSGATVAQAAAAGTGFSLALFLGDGAQQARLLDQYRATFRPSARTVEPTCNIAVAGVCAETEAAARATLTLAGQGGLVGNVVGTPAQCRAQLLELADRHGVDEVVFRDLSATPAGKLASYALLAGAFDLARAGREQPTVAFAAAGARS